jgi:hypothetical protein
MLSKRSLTAAVIGGVGGASAFYLLKAVPFNVFVSIPLGGMIAAACYELVLRQRLSLGMGAILGFLAGVVMSVLVVIWTIAVTGIGHYEFAAAMTFIPVFIGILAALGGWVAAFFIVNS